MLGTTSDNQSQETATSMQGNNQGARPRKKKRGRALIFFAVFVIVVALGCLGFLFYTYHHQQEEYDSLTQYLNVEDTSNPNLGNMTVDWKGLSKINSDIVGWMFFPDTNINYPIVWRGDDDSYYMTHNFGQTSAGAFGAEYGCPVLSSVNSPKWTDQINFVAAHNMIDGSMFTFFDSMKETSVFNSHRTIYVLTPEGNFKLEAISCDKIIGSSTTTVIPNFNTEQEFHAYIQESLDASLVNPNPKVTSIDNIKQLFGFYTCNGPDDSYRVMVYAEVKEFLPFGSTAAKNSSMVDQKDIDKLDSAVNERLG